MTTSWAETRRREIWWSEIEWRRNGRTDYALSALVTNLVGDDLPGIERRRLFESAKGGKHPTGLPGGRSLAQVAELVPGFEGTAAFFHSPIWELLDPRGRTLLEISDLVEKELAVCGLRRDLLEDYWASHAPIAFANHYMAALAAALPLLPDIRQLSLLATLCAEACASGESTVDELLRRHFDEAIQLNSFGRKIIKQRPVAPEQDERDGGIDFDVYEQVVESVCYPHLSTPAQSEDRTKVATRARRLIYPVPVDGLSEAS